MLSPVVVHKNFGRAALWSFGQLRSAALGPVAVAAEDM